MSTSWISSYDPAGSGIPADCTLIQVRHRTATGPGGWHAGRRKQGNRQTNHRPFDYRSRVQATLIVQYTA